jgi:hypothetical protein
LFTLKVLGRDLEEGTERQKLGGVDLEPILAGCQRC